MDRGRLFAVSLGAHALLGVAVAAVRPEVRHEAVAIALRESKKAAPAPQLTPPPDKDVATPQPRPARAKTAPPGPAKAASLSARSQAAATLDALPDFGLSLSGGGPGGLAVPAGERADRVGSTGTPQAKVLARAVARADDCADPPAKPRPLSRPAPAYTEDARAAGVSGKVRVEITVDEHGRVVSAHVIQGLGHGLDEAALAAARVMAFEPAVRCGKPVSATFKIGFHFAPSSP